MLLDTNSCCAHTKQIDPAFRRSVVDEQQSELVQSSFRSQVVQTDCFLPIGTRQMHASSPTKLQDTAMRTCLQLHVRYVSSDSSGFAPSLMGLVLSVASVLHTGRLCANVHRNRPCPLILSSSLCMLGYTKQPSGWKRMSSLGYCA